MKGYAIAILVCCCAVLGSCSKEDKLPEIRPAASGTYTDERDANTYEWIRVGNLEWMTSNLKYYETAPYYECTYNVLGVPCAVSVYTTTNLEADYEEYGNFYTWEEAKALCPEVWRLPTDEDWKDLEMALGMSERDANAEGWRGDREATLLRQGKDGLGMNLRLAGNVSNSNRYAGAGLNLWLTFVGESGYYWTATESDKLSTPNVWFRKIFADYETVYRGVTTLNKLMRVRCCRDAGK